MRVEKNEEVKELIERVVSPASVTIELSIEEAEHLLNIVGAIGGLSYLRVTTGALFDKLNEVLDAGVYTKHYGEIARNLTLPTSSTHLQP